MYPMSFEQESIWLNDQFDPGSSRYLESWTWRLRGPLDLAAVRAALDGIVARHESLRSALTLVDGVPRQTVLPPGPVPLARHAVAPGRLDIALKQAVTNPVPLDAPPLLRATLLDVGPGDAVLAVSVHHAVVDGWCLQLLDVEFTEFYRAAVEGRKPVLPELPIQFGKFAVRQRSAPPAEDDLAYWTEVMADAPAECAFPLDRPRPRALRGTGAQVEFTVEAETNTAIRALCRRLRVTPFAVLTANLTLLLARLGGHRDVVLGTPVSRRDDASVLDMMACLTDVMPLRQDVDPAATFAELAVSTKDAVRAAMTHRGVPSTRLVAELAGERTRSRFPLFQVVLTVDDADSPGLDLPGIEAERLYVHSGTSKFDVFFNLVPHDGGIRGLLEYSAELFDARSAERLAERFAHLLAVAVAAPDTPLGALPVTTEGERKLVQDWSRGPVPGEVGASVLPAFEARAREHPDVVAVVDGERSMTYGELDEASAALASALVRGGHAGGTVGVLLERSAEAATAVLGVLRAGACCVPLDPSYPAERLAFMMTDSGMSALVTDRAGRFGVPDGVVVLSPGQSPGDAELPDPVGADPAYLIYTSGSTGLPKGVLVPHRALANLAAWQVERSGMALGAVTAQFAPLSFDVSFQELFATWTAAGTLAIVDEASRRDPRRLLDLIERVSVERLFLPYVALQQLAEYSTVDDRAPGSLREVVSAGEQLFVTPAVREFFTRSGARLDNQYGPSETHVVTAMLLDGPAATWPERPGIGRPIAGAGVAILDADLAPVPAGSVGEICVTGVPVGLGYLNRGDLTRERFVLREDAVHYRTGDLARFGPDGEIEFLGRRDGQVKIRGHRVEPGELESAVLAVAGVTDAAVVVDGEGGDRRLLAYYVGTLAPRQLRRALADALPPQLVPALCLPVEAFPLTPSGKVDRAALPLPHQAVEPQREAVAPTGPTQIRMAAIFAELLGSPVGADDDFFTHGGDSLLAVRLMLAVRAEWGVRLDLTAVFAAPTVARLAALIDEPDPGGDGAIAVPELDPDVVPADVIVPLAPDPEHVFLTGATGFLGVYVLRELLAETRATVHCLVRGDASRLRAAMDRYGLWREEWAGRVAVVSGDLELRRFGLGEEVFGLLASTVDAVYHVGAGVNLAESFERLHDANVGGTVEALRLAATGGRSVPFHHVSTVGVFGGSRRHVRPGDDLGDGSELRHGYARSKWAAEKAVEQARDRGLPVSVHRPTRITGDLDHGLGQTGDYMWLLLKGCIEAGMAPDSHGGFDLVPVDRVAAAVVTLSRARLGTFHIAAGRHVTLPVLFDRLRALGYRLDTVPAAAWTTAVEQDPANAAYPLLSLHSSEADPESSVVYDAAETRELAGDFPAFDAGLFARHVEAFVSSGFLPPPPASPSAALSAAAPAPPHRD